MEKYTSWENVPENLKTKTSLAKMGLRLAKGQQPVATKTAYYQNSPYKLYDVNEAVPKRTMSDDQKLALEKARQASPQMTMNTGAHRQK